MRAKLQVWSIVVFLVSVFAVIQGSSEQGPRGVALLFCGIGGLACAVGMAILLARGPKNGPRQ